MSLLFCEVKGDVVVNQQLGWKFLVPSTSIKMQSLGRRDDIIYGLDVGRTTDKPMKITGLPASHWIALCPYVCVSARGCGIGSEHAMNSSDSSLGCTSHAAYHDFPISSCHNVRTVRGAPNTGPRSCVAVLIESRIQSLGQKPQSETTIPKISNLYTLSLEP